MTTIREAAAVTRTGPGRVMLTLITPGIGASGEYAPEVLEAAAKDNVFPRGTQSHINHDTELERLERPQGDLRNLAMVTVEDAVWEPDWVDPETGVKGRLAAESRVSSAWRDFVEEFGEFIGASVVANADIKEAANGRIVKKLYPSKFNRCDLVTVAGRGGGISEVLEAARVIESRSMVSETTANDVESWLRAAVRDTYGTGDEYAWLQDYDATNVYYQTGGHTYRQAYTLNGVDVTLTGAPVEVRRRVEYDPVTKPAVEAANDSPSNLAGATENTKEAATMATTQIEEAELTQLRESAGRVTALEAELNTERATRAEEAKAARKDKAEAIVKEAFGDDVPAFFLTAATMLSESADFDAKKFHDEAVEAAAKIAADAGAGQPHGVGQTTLAESKTFTSEDIVSVLEGGK